MCIAKALVVLGNPIIIRFCRNPARILSGLSVSPKFIAPADGHEGEWYSFRLTVTDEFGGSSADSVDVFIEYVNHDPTANAGTDITRDENSPVTLNGSGSDQDGDSLSFSWTQISGTFVVLSGSGTATPSFKAPNINMASEGLVFELRVGDEYNGFATDRVTVTVQDVNSPPLCAKAAASTAFIWPPNHKMVSSEILGVSDPDNDNVTIVVTGVTQDEPLNGLGDGNTSPDASIQGDKVLLRAERTGIQNGRIYNVGFTATDSSGESCSGAVAVCVPHDKSPKKMQCIDDGQIYNSLGD